MNEKLSEKERISIIEKASLQVGRPIFLSTLIIIVSFLPVFMLTGQEQKLFTPLAWTKTFVLFGSAILSITLVPVLMSFFLKGKIKSEKKNPVSRFMNGIYEPILRFCLRYKMAVLGVNILA